MSELLSGIETQFQATCKKEQAGLKRIQELKGELKLQRCTKGLVEEELCHERCARKLAEKLSDAQKLQIEIEAV